MNQALQADALWGKARLFLNWAMDDYPARSFDERALWASLALELLAKAALARISPLLIAEPTGDDGHSMLSAAGLIQSDRVTTVRAKAVMARCAKAFPPFSDVEAAKILMHRNEYLHGGSPRFSSLPEHVFWPRYWAQATTLVEAMDRDLSSLLGARASIVEVHLAQNQKNLNSRYASLVKAAERRLELRSSDQTSVGLHRTLAPKVEVTMSSDHIGYAECPVCDETGILEGSEVLEENYTSDGEDAWLDLVIGASYFSCSNCQLALDGLELLEMAKLETSFTVEGDPSDYYGESEYFNE